VADTDQVFYGLHAVFDHGSNFATIRCTGAFTVDWGDGSSPVNVASNTTAEYNYSYAAGGLGAVTSRGYKTAIVTVTPQAGETLSAIDLSLKHTQSGLVNGHSSQWLDMRLAMNNVGTVTTFVNSNWRHRLLERFEWVGGSSVQTSFLSFLNGCASLQSLPLFNTAAGTSFQEFLSNCTSLQSVPLFNTAAGTNFSAFLGSCTSLQSVPLFNTAAGTTFSFFLRDCASLQSLPLFNTAAGTSFSFFLRDCASLQSLRLFNTAAGTSFSGFLSGCASISRIQATFPAGQSFSLANLALGPDALNEIYINLPTASGTPTITVTGNWGTAAHDPTIATNKGWTVTA
jgi:hypothetical protein